MKVDRRTGAVSGADPYELDPCTLFIECTLDDIVVVDDEGFWEFEEGPHSWADYDPKRPMKSWIDYSDWGVDIEIDDGDGVFEKVGELIENNIPQLPGRYKVTGDVYLEYEATGATYTTKYYYYDDSEEGDIDTDAVEVEYLKDESYVSNFKFWEL